MSVPGTEKMQKEMLNHKMADVLNNIINSCVYPERALRAVLVDLEPIRAILKEYHALYPPAPSPSDKSKKDDNSGDILVFES